MSTSAENEIVQEPSMAKNYLPSRAPKNGAQLQTTWRSAKNAALHGAKRLSTAITAIRGSYRHGTVRTLSMNCKCGTSAVFCTPTTNTCRCTPRACQRPCPRTGRTTSTTCTTGTSTTLSAYCNCGHLSLHNSGHVNNLQELHLERGNRHCGYLSLRNNWNVHHFDDEPDLRHLKVFVRHELLELELRDHRDVRQPPPPASAPCPGTH